MVPRADRTDVVSAKANMRTPVQNLFMFELAVIVGATNIAEGLQ